MADREPPSERERRAALELAKAIFKKSPKLAAKYPEMAAMTADCPATHVLCGTVQYCTLPAGHREKHLVVIEWE